VNGKAVWSKKKNNGILVTNLKRTIKVTKMPGSDQSIKKNPQPPNNFFGSPIKSLRPQRKAIDHAGDMSKKAYFANFHTLSIRPNFFFNVVHKILSIKYSHSSSHSLFLVFTLTLISIKI